MNDDKKDEIPIHIKKNLINVVMRQTDYDEKIAGEKLEEYNYEVMDVIRNFMNPNYSKKDNENSVVTNVHQQKFTEIRNMMDDASNVIENKKKSKNIVKK